MSMTYLHNLVLFYIDFFIGIALKTAFKQHRGDPEEL